MKKRYLTLILLIVIHAIATAQISIKSIPISFKFSLKNAIPSVEIPNILPQLPTINNKIPARAGYTLPFYYNLSDNGLWVKVDNSFVWRLEVVVPEAVAVNLYFNNINLEDGEKLFLYNQQKKLVLGAFTSINNGMFMCTDFVPGDTIIIELKC